MNINDYTTMEEYIRAAVREKSPHFYKPGQQVPESGIYRVFHDPQHGNQEHEVTCVKGEPFPPCNHCGHHPRFGLVRSAHHIQDHEHFRKR